MNRTLQRIYDSSPAVLQDLWLSAYSIYIHCERYGKAFNEVYAEFLKNQWLSHEQLVSWQNERIRRLIEHAYCNVPYYRDVMNNLNLRPADIRSGQDLAKLPVLTREDIKENSQRLVAENIGRLKRKGLVKGHTSGTTGSPLEFYWDRATCVVNNAVDWRQKSWAGIGQFERCAVILGRTIVPIDRQRPPFWRVNHIHRTLWLSAFHMSPENLPLYVRALKEFKPSYIEGYPSTLYILAKFITARREQVPLKAAFTSSETLFPVQRDTIEEAFGTRLFDFYGLAERVVFATECEQHSGHHLNMDYGLSEIVDGEGQVVKRGELGWMVGTGLHNFAMPLIRYKTNDITRERTSPCPCGRQFPLVDDVTTKAEDIITTLDGRFISSSTLTHPFKPLENIVESQIVQEDISNIVIKIVKGPAYCDKDTTSLVEAMSARIGKGMDIHVEFVDRIARTASGKLRWVISKVPLRIG
ncbi:MAG TPA: hypothetical protein VN317_03705 [Candidatus Methanoperedens sp.]|nr:hypothetical protein [Candidatus Methanoperedens sp.]